MNVGHIIRGWGMKLGVIPTSEAEAKLSELRLRVCRECPFVGESSFLKIINGSVENESELYCTKCSCPCLEKTLVVDEQCPVKRW
jgi:hypothetical protein